MLACGSYRWFRLKDHFLTMLLAQNETSIGIHRSHCPQKKDQNTSCIKLPHYRIHHFANFSYFSWYLTHPRNTWWVIHLGASCWSSTSPWQRMSKRCLPWWREVWQQRWRCRRGRTDHQVPWQLHGQLWLLICIDPTYLPQIWPEKDPDGIHMFLRKVRRRTWNLPRTGQ